MENVEKTEQTVSEEVVTEEEANMIKEVSKSPDSYQLIRDMLKEMKDYQKMMEDETRNILHRSYHLSSEAMVPLAFISNSKINSMSLTEINDFFDKYVYKSYTSIEYDDVEEARLALHEVKKLQYNLMEIENEYKKIQAESNDIFNEYAEFLSSEKVMNARKARIDKMKELVKNEPDKDKRREIERKIKYIEMTQSLDFIFTRLDNFGDKEKKNVITAFFDDKRGSYIINRYKDKITKFGFDVNLYKYFFNLEENFLSEEYHVFNNLFLFYYMRFVAYSNPYDEKNKLYVQAFTSAIANLVYHKFPKDKKNEDNPIETPVDESNVNAAEQRFIKILEKFASFFEDQREYFFENNTMRPGHPVREEMTAKREMERKAELLKKMEELNITGYDENMTANELQEYFNSKLDEVIEQQKKERDAEKASAEEKESDTPDDGVTPDDDNPVESDSCTGENSEE